MKFRNLDLKILKISNLTSVLGECILDSKLSVLAFIITS